MTRMPWVSAMALAACSARACSTHASAEVTMPNPANRSRMTSVDSTRTLSSVQPAASRFFSWAANSLRVLRADLRVMGSASA